jgi:hypothetical protein
MPEHEYNNTRRCKIGVLLLGLLILICIGYSIYMIYRRFHKNEHHFKYERFTKQPSYLEELTLYQSFNTNQRQEYLNMSRSDKIAKYNG